MNDYLLLMHDDAPAGAQTDAAWALYFSLLRAQGPFDGGSAIGAGVCVSKHGPAKAITAHLSGYIRVQAESLEAAKRLLNGNPVYESGGTVEIRELPRD